MRINVRLICFAVVVESTDKLYYKEANPDDTDSMHKTVSDIGNMLEHRLEKYLYGIKCRNNLAKIVLSYYEDGVINKEQLNVEYEVFLKSGDKANYYKSDEEIKRLLPDLRKDMTESSTIIELNQFADSYIIWSDILEENNESVLLEYRNILNKMLKEAVRDGKEADVSYLYELSHMSSDKTKKIYQEEIESMKKFLIETYVEYLQNTTHGKKAYEYSRKLRNYYGDSSYHDIIVSESKKLYNENSFPISEVDEELGWSRLIGSSIKDSDTAGYNSVLSSRADISKDCYLEVSYVHGEAKVGEHCVLSYIDIHDEVIPDNVVMHGLKQRDGKFIVRIFGVNDNPKENRLFGMDLEQIEKDLDVKLWPDDSHTLWSAALYPEADTIEEAVSAALNLYAIVHGEEQADLSAWKAAPKKSLCSGFNDADPDAIIAWNRRMADLVAMDEIAKAIRNKVPAAKLRKMKSLTKIQKEWLERRIKKADFSEKMRLHYYLGVILDDEDEVQECFRTIQSEVLASTIKNLSYNENARIVTEKHTVKLPLRVNWGGGWSDTPPYCNENGGTVLNVAILLNGQKPVEVTLEKISEKKIVFDSRDMDVHGEFDTIEPLQATGDPFDPFALQKACLLACGIIPKEGSSLEEILDRLGGGFEMHSEVTNVPKGSGLGTSSILSAACVKAVFEFMGIAYTEEDLYAHVLAMEQIMSTGGGWQDQVGGITPGLKYITSMPGIDQKLKVTHVEIPEAAKQELSDRFVLIYTGQRRLARNLLRDVVGRYVGNEPESLFALEEIQKTAALMRFELERGNVDGFASLLDYHWELSKKVDAGSSNTLIEQIFSSIEELIDGKLVCGAGGGGFLQVILKKGVTRQQVEERLNEVFMDSLVGVADCRLVWE